MHENIVSLIIVYKSINPRISVLKGQFFDITFVNGHAPTEEKAPEKKNEFYDNLEHTINETPRSRIRIVLGYF